MISKFPNIFLITALATLIVLSGCQQKEVVSVEERDELLAEQTRLEGFQYLRG